MAEDKADKGKDAGDNGAGVEPEKSVAAHFDGPFGGYTVTAATTHLRDDKDKEKATIFSVSYVLDGGDASRPVTFCLQSGRLCPGRAA